MSALGLTELTALVCNSIFYLIYCTVQYSTLQYECIYIYQIYCKRCKSDIKPLSKDVLYETTLLLQSHNVKILLLGALFGY